jgi:riboflavin kinase/FMN adenylyltransferase
MVRSIRLKDIKKDEFTGAGTVMVIGFFDGVHRGHQEIISLCVRQAKKTGGTSIALTFDLPPLNLRKNRLHKKLILTYDEKINLIKDMGIEFIVTAGISRRFLDLTPEQFCDRILVEVFDIEELYIGTGFRFGKDAAGDVAFLKKYLGKNNIKVNEVDLIKSRGEIISSTVIRKYYSEGNIKRIKQLLGRDPYLKGRVTKGSGRGKRLGIPTINIDADESLVLPADGVYLGTVSEEKDHSEKLPAVVNIGDNPTFGDRKKRVESHILDFDSDMYRKMIKIEFLERIREEIKFENVEDLIRQVKKDIEKGREYFRSK